MTKNEINKMIKQSEVKTLETIMHNNKGLETNMTHKIRSCNLEISSLKIIIEN